jgi:hypothetical protein
LLIIGILAGKGTCEGFIGVFGHLFRLFISLDGLCVDWLVVRYGTRQSMLAELLAAQLGILFRILPDLPDFLRG